jgi:adenylate cyclase 8
MGFSKAEYLVWYVLFIVFVTYAILPLPLRWSIATGALTSTLHLIITAYAKLSQDTVSAVITYSSFRWACYESVSVQGIDCVIRQLVAMSLEYAAVNFAGMYTKYLTDRSQRKAFLETHKSTETRFKTQRENEQQEKLLLSGTPTK